MFRGTLAENVRYKRPGATDLEVRDAAVVAQLALSLSLLIGAASLRPFIGLDAAPACAAALSGLALTLIGAMLLDWLLRDVRLDGPPPCESVVMARLGALQEIVAGNAWGPGAHGL